MPLLTLGQTAAAKARLIVWCRKRLHRLEPETAALAEAYDNSKTVLDCADCAVPNAARDTDFLVRRRSSHGDRWSSRYPSFGGLGVTFIVTNFAPEAEGHSVPEVTNDRL